MLVFDQLAHIGPAHTGLLQFVVWRQHGEEVEPGAVIEGRIELGVHMPHGIAMPGIGDAAIGFDRLCHGQKATLSPPFSFSMARASSGVATSSESSVRILRIFVTCSALLLASRPGPR